MRSTHIGGKATAILFLALGAVASAQSTSRTWFGPVHSVKTGMASEDVRRILGTPMQITSDVGVEEWRYCASRQEYRTVVVYFDADRVIAKEDLSTEDAQPCSWNVPVRAPRNVRDLRVTRAPGLIIVHGGSLPRPVALSNNWLGSVRNDNYLFLAAVERTIDAAPESLAGRPFYEFALHWNPKLPAPEQQFVTQMHRQLLTKTKGKTDLLKPSRGDQNARFYPAVGREPAAFVFMDDGGTWRAASRRPGVVRAVDESGLALVAKAGIPVREGR